jgi:hypothetical protein
MANETYTLIQKTTLNASAASITFSSIPQTFTVLVVKVSARGTTSAKYGYLFMRLNGATTNYSGRVLYGDNATAGSTTNSSASYLNPGIVTMATSTASTFASSEFYIPNYTSANAKSISCDAVSEDNTSYVANYLMAQLWNDTAAITSIVLSPDSGNFAEFTEATLYGVAKQGVNPVAGPKASGGDIITNDGTYWIHQFLNSGTFTPNRTLSCDYLVVAGGAGGGFGSGGGGGGAGGLRSTVTATGRGGSLESALSVTTQSYAITIGAGGAAVISSSGTRGTNGSNSTFSTITSTGGGGGGSEAAGISNGASGGAGGGGNYYSSGAGGAGTTGQGYDGAIGGGNYSGGGGGGAGAAGGASPATGTGGPGGNGVAVAITGSSVTYAGGAGAGGETGGTGTGGTGGTGGGGQGGARAGAAATAGSKNLGGGGGGGAYYGSNPAGGAGASGGSGIVIIRYAM